MAINRTPVLKRCRQLGLDPVVLGYSSSKTSKRQVQRRRKESEYGMQLREKQKAKFIYGVLEKQFRGYFDKARRQQGVTGDNLMRILESRLDKAPKSKDLLVIKSALVSNERFEVPAWLEVDIEKLQGSVLALPERDQIDLEINEQLIVELYSK